MNISFDPKELKPHEAKALSAFVLAFAKVEDKAPAVTFKPSEGAIFAHKDQTFAEKVNDVAPISPFDLPDSGQSSPGEAFGDPVAQAFPLVLGDQQPAPSTVAAVASTIAPAVNSPTPGTLPGLPNVAQVASVPAAPAAHVAPSTPANGVELDGAGLPWDARIHASTKTKTAKGVWTYRRGVDDSLKAEVEAQLRQLMGHTPAAAATPQPAWSFTPPAAPAQPVAAPTPAAPAAPAVDISSMFIGLVQRVGAAKVANTLTDAEVTAACQQFGIPALPLAMSRPDQLPSLDAHITALINSRG